MSEPLKERCETCRFWNRDEADTGDCCRFPPTLTSHGAPFDNEERCDATQFPLTYAGQWCGEWKPRDEPEAE